MKKNSKILFFSGMMMLCAIHSASFAAAMQDTSHFELISWDSKSPPKVRYNGQEYFVVGTRFEKMRKPDDLKKIKTPQEIRDFFMQKLEENRARARAKQASSPRQRHATASDKR